MADVADLLGLLASDTRWAPEVRHAAAASLTAGAAGSSGTNADSTTAHLVDVVKYPAIFGTAAAAVAASRLMAAADSESDLGDRVQRALSSARLSRRTLLRGAAFTTAALAFPTLAACERIIVPSTLLPGGVTASPNLLQIVVDDLNEYVGFLGGYPGTIHTPNLDALAAESLSFEQFHVTVPICPPSRATLMWGVDALTHQVYKRDIPAYLAFALAQPDHVTNVLANAGFTQYGGGKIFHESTDNSYHRPQWDHYLPTQYAAFDPPSGPDNIFFDYGTHPAGVDHPDQLLADFAIAKMQALAGNPVSRFHIALGFRLPHLGWVVPQAYLDMYPLDDVVVHDPTDGFDDLGPIGRSVLAPEVSLYWSEPRTWMEWVLLNGDRRVYLQHYLASISYVDHQIGRVLNELAAQPYANDTAVTLVSDNGYHHGENNTMRKGALRDQSTRVPFLIRHPDLTPQSFSTPVSSLDYAPTLLGLIGVTPPASMEGVDLVRELPTGFVTSYYRGNDPQALSRSHIATGDPQYRWVFHEVEPGHPRFNEGAYAGYPEVELYDRHVDPHETINLLG
ncbi:MAG: sulfatase-like hydrolase/transferase [Acidimicrobiales bacterium]|nr:sulfatase-like hydrolase/transferase [Acidimicrobiales bacterium]